MQKALIGYPLLTFGEVVDKDRCSVELDGKDMIESNKKAKIES